VRSPRALKTKNVSKKTLFFIAEVGNLIKSCEHGHLWRDSGIMKPHREHLTAPPACDPLLCALQLLSLSLSPSSLFVFLCMSLLYNPFLCGAPNTLSHSLVTVRSRDAHRLGAAASAEAGVPETPLLSRMCRAIFILSASCWALKATEPISLSTHISVKTNGGRANEMHTLCL